MDRERGFLRGYWPVLATVPLLFAICTTPLALLTAGTIRGIVIGAASASCVWLIVMMVMQFTGTASTRMGEIAERWTAKQLASLGPGWIHIHDVPFIRMANVDHIVISGGSVFAIETKWRSQSWRVAPRPEWSVLAAAKQASAGAESLRELLAHDGTSTTVTSVLAWWSSESAKGKSGMHQQIGSTHVVPGSELARWLTATRPAAHEGPRADDIAESIARHVHALEDAAPDLRPDSWLRLLLPWVAIPILALFGTFATVASASLASEPSTSLVMTLALASLGLVRVGRPDWRPAALSWMTATLATGALLLLLVLFG